MKIRSILAIVGLVILVLAGGAVQTGRPEPEPVVRFVPLPESLKLPAVGNIDAVRTWRFGRIEQVVDQGNSPDIFIEVRTFDALVRVAAPPAELAQFARASNWLESPDKQRPGRSDYIERMVAFDADPAGRLIAMISLEPMNRNRNRLFRALSG